MELNILKKIGLSDKEINVYLASLQMGPSPVRKIAAISQINRGTCYDVLKSLIKMGLVSYYNKDKHQYFVAEDPNELEGLLAKKHNELNEAKQNLAHIIPQLKSFATKQDRPVVKYFEGSAGVKKVLQDVLNCMAAIPETGDQDKEYYVFSSQTIRPYLYKIFPDYTEQRIKNGIKVKVIALGAGGEAVPALAERRWLFKEGQSAIYLLMYAGKVSYISVDSTKSPLAVIIEDSGIYKTQKMLFENLWEKIPKS